MEVIAHRGASHYAPDNSRAALQLAWQLGADRVEMDVRVSADGVPFLCHEAQLPFPPANPRPVNQLRWTQLKKLPLPHGEPPLTLGEALELLRGKVPVYVDVKDPAAMDPVAGTLRGFEEAIVGCRYPDALLRFSSSCSHLPTSLQLKEPDPTAITTARGCGAKFVHLCWERLPNPWEAIGPREVDRLRAAGFEVILWQEDRAWVLRRLARLDVFGVCTNAPDRARKALGLEPPTLVSEAGDA
jgi:glycerophosphoryl diester phosphodiesterase